MAIRKQHSDQLNLFAWSDSQGSGSEIAIPSKDAIIGKVIDVRLRFQERTSAFVKSFVSGDFRPPIDAGQVIDLSDYRPSADTADESNWRGAYGQ